MLVCQNSMFHCVIMRGGTSKIVFFRDNDLPQDTKLREKIILAVMGSPDATQIDGLGGAFTNTSKVAIIAPSERADADVDYTFVQVGIKDSVIDWRSSCGNTAAAVGPFAIDQGFVKAVEPVTTVRIFNTNTNKIMTAKVPVRNGEVGTDGDYEIEGVPGSGPEISMDFSDPAGSVTGKLLPTGNPKDIITLDDGRKFTVTLVDAGNPAVLMLADELGLSGTESPDEISPKKELMDTMEKVRSVGCQMMGIVSDWKTASKLSPATPKIGYFAHPKNYITSSGKQIRGENINILGRLMSTNMPHRTYMVTGGIFTGAASIIPGTILFDLVSKKNCTDPTILIGHPAGIMKVEIRAEILNNEVSIKGIAVGRTARKILEGYVYVPQKRLS